MEFISAIEPVCHKLLDWGVQELRTETNCLLRKAKPPKSNIIKEEQQGTQETKGRQRKNGVNSRQGSGHGGNGQKGVHGKSGRLIGTTGLQENPCRPYK